MKHLLTIIAALSLIVTACQKDPIADASITPNPAYVGEDITFDNFSTNTDYTEWDMGDGSTSTAYNVKHSYVDPGNYTVTQRSFRDKGGMSSASYVVEVTGSELKIIVKEFWEEYLVPDVEIYLFLNLDAWDNIDFDQAVGPFYTDRYGEVTISGLSYQRYYVDAYYQSGNQGYHNWFLGDEDVIHIETQLLTGWEYHTFIAYVDEVTFETKKSASATNEVRKTRIPSSPVAGQKKATGQDRPIKENKFTQPREKK
jgi:PKD repeat protein